MLGFNKKSKNVETVEKTKITLISGAEPVIWDISTTPSFRFLNGNIVEAYGNIETHAEKFSEIFDYYAIDLKHELVVEGQPVSHIALTEHEAWDLSVALVQEMESRKDSEEEYKKIIVVVNNAVKLLSRTDPENTDLWLQFRGYMQTIDTEAANYGIHVLYA